jgi:hypothetical protein
MPKTNAWNFVNQSVHHDNTRCGPGGAIPQRNREAGTGGKPLCENCKRLHSEEKLPK